MSEYSDSGPDHLGDKQAKPTGRSFWLKQLAFLAVGAFLIFLFLPVTRHTGHGSRRLQCMSHVRLMGMALSSYKEAHGALPPAYTVDANGKPLHSWRTLILPHLEEKSLYEKIDLSKPWDDPANAVAFKTAVSVYQCPSTDCPPNHTTYLASVGPNSCLHPDRPRDFSEITDKKSDTLMVIEVAPEQSVPWMAPQDADEALILSLGPKSKLAHPSGMSAVFCDLHVTSLSDDTPAADRRAMISVAGNDGPID